MKRMRFNCLGATALWLLAVAAVTVQALLAQPLLAQPVLDVREELDFDRPEAWAMKYFSSVTLLTGMGAPERLAPWTVEVGLEAGWVPSLSREERTVGFYGTKEEDLNKTSVFGRGRLTVGLPAAFSVTLSWVPPVEVGGVEPNLFAASLGRPLYEGQRFRLGARLFAQGGSLVGDITCGRETAAAGDDPVRNPFGCQEPSRDELTLRSTGVELAAGWTAGSSGRLQPYAALAATRLEPELQVDARYAGVVDRTLQVTEGTVYSLTVGLGYDLGESTRLATEAFYAPLDVVRRPGAERESQDLLNLRLMVSYRLR